MTNRLTFLGNYTGWFSRATLAEPRVRIYRLVLLLPLPCPAQDRDYIGFATLPEQVHRKSVKRGFEFTLMVLGESGLGKSTLINSLFLGDLYKDRRIPDALERVEKTTSIEKKTMDIEERGVRLRLTIVDTPGFGDAVNGEDTWKACSAYIDEQFRQYFTDESGLNRKNIQDNRVHCCLYFIPPYGHGLRQLDLEVLKRLHRKVNVVPVIAKADTLTTSEVKKLKERILTDIEEHEIQIYQFPDCDSDEDEEFKQQDKELKACIPFAVIGSSTVLEVAGRKVRGRQYPWGVVEVENPKHSDFVKLRTMLISTHMQDLKDVTQDVHYENFRAQCISQISQQAIRERSKLKRDSGPHFDNSISDTDRLLLQKDEEVKRYVHKMNHGSSVTFSEYNTLFTDKKDARYPRTDAGEVKSHGTSWRWDERSRWKSWKRLGLD
ncbi:septin-2 [Orussus abietinus]|nr:septin-2 [Orussus abietinus]